MGRPGDPLFLLNIDTDTLYGTFAAGSAGAKDISPDVWNGRYPYQVRVTKNGRMDSAKGAKKILTQMGLSWRDALVPEAAEALTLN